MKQGNDDQQRTYEGRPGVNSPDDYRVAPNLHGTERGGVKIDLPKIDPKTQAKHEESIRKYPELALSKGEYVLAVVHRHPIGLVFIWGFVLLMAVLAWAATLWYQANGEILASLFLVQKVPDVASLIPLVYIFMAFLALGGIVATLVYVDNRFYLTNESVFQFLRTGILQTKMQVINLINVEDASHEQNGILQNLFNYGTLRLSTQGQETVYHFYYVSNPHKLVTMVNDAGERAVRRLEGFPAGEY